MHDTGMRPRWEDKTLHFWDDRKNNFFETKTEIWGDSRNKNSFHWNIQAATCQRLIDLQRSKKNWKTVKCKKNSKMAKWQNSKMAKWQNSKMEKWQNSKMAKLWRGQSSPFGDKTGLALDAALVILIKSYFSLSFSRFLYSHSYNRG